MKKLSAVFSLMLVLVAFVACSDSAKSSDVNADIENIPILIDRAMLTDAVWGEGEEIPQDVTCVAGSQFEFDAMRNPFIIAPNDGSDSHYTAAVVAVSSLNVQMLAGDGDMRGETCAEGDLFYLVSASADNPIDIEVVGETCPDLTALATADGTGFPANGTVTAHFESQEVVTVIPMGKPASDAETSDGQVKLTETGNPDNPEEATPQDDGEEAPQDTDDNDDHTFEYTEKLFKLVIDSCNIEETAVEVVAE